MQSCNNIPLLAKTIVGQAGLLRSLDDDLDPDSFEIIAGFMGDLETPKNPRTDDQNPGLGGEHLPEIVYTQSVTSLSPPLAVNPVREDDDILGVTLIIDVDFAKVKR